MGKILFFFWAIPLAFSAPALDWKGSQYQVRRKYLKLHKKFFQKLCQRGDHTYQELNLKFRGTGFFIPHLGEIELDRAAITGNLELIEKKVQWIKAEREKIKRKKNFKRARKKLKQLHTLFVEAMEIKANWQIAKKNQAAILQKGRSQLRLLEQATNALLDQVSFLKPFGYPVDHFAMRKDYDYYKMRQDMLGQKRKNDIGFRRKIFEDGAQNPNHTQSDRFFRALTNTLNFQLQQQGAIIDENLRYDFDYFLTTLERYLKHPVAFHRKRLGEWLDRTQRTLDFYRNILLESRRHYTKEMLGKRSQAKYQLKKFNFAKQRKVYDFWLQQSELNRALFVIESILFNEVGDIDGRDALERRDVAQVVINRTKIPFYRTIEETESLSPYLASIGRRKLAQSKWLNVMFKEGEFSFTYFFIPSSQKVYCPDMSRRGRFLRKENLAIALEILKNPNDGFKAIRYFSRASMLGRIDMAPIWSNFRPLPPRRGSKSAHGTWLKISYHRRKYRFLYQFADAQGRLYQVLMIRNQPRVYDPATKQFFSYRNPHWFTYFAPQ